MSDALVDLLVKQVTEGLAPDEQRELDLMDGARVSEELRDLERAAAAATLAGLTLEEPPVALRAALERAGEEFLAPGKVVELKVAAARGTGSVAGSRRRDEWGWYAAAACLVLAVVGWVRSPPRSVAPVAAVQPGPPVVAAARPQAPPPSPAAARAALLARADTLKVTLGATKDPAAAGVNGDAVWDPVAQRGFLHFVGLASNDPSVRQYQIWIFDGTRDQRYPVDGGVFDVPGDASDVVIPVHAALPIGELKAFAVTVEKPGGVVVSGRTHVVVLGAVG